MDAIKALEKTLKDPTFGTTKAEDDATAATKAGTEADKENASAKADQTEASKALTKANKELADATKASTNSVKDYDSAMKALSITMSLLDVSQEKLEEHSQAYRDGMKQKAKLIQNEIDLTKKQISLNTSNVNVLTALEGKASVASGNATASEAGNQIVAKAKEYLGTPYVWGGSSTKGFDCSGLVSYVYKELGTSISRTSQAQSKDGVAVAKKDLQPGDLVFFGDASAPHHVGIYMGGDQYLHSPKTGDKVKISTLSSRADYAGARRVSVDGASNISESIGTSSNSSSSSSSSGKYAGGYQNGKYKDWINEYGAKYGINPNLLAGVIQTESAFNPNARNKGSGATGLGQFLASTAQDEGLSDRTDPESSIAHLASYLKKRIGWAGGNVNKGVMGYGEGTQAYLNKVLANTPGGSGNANTSGGTYSGSGISSSDNSTVDGGSDNLLSTIDSEKTSLIDLQRQLAEIPYAISKNRLAEFDDDVADVTKKMSTLKNESDKSTDGNKRVTISKEMDTALHQELKLTQQKADFLKSEIASRKYTIGQVAEMNGELLDTLDAESSIQLAFQQQFADRVAIVQSAESKVTEIINKQVEKRKKIISDQYDAEKKAITDTQALYSKQNTTDDYNKNLTTEQKSLNDINASITSASRDTSSSGQARVAQLKLDLKTQQDKIDAMVLDRGRTLNADKYDTASTLLDTQNTATLKKMDDTYSEENIAKLSSDAVVSGMLTDINGKVISLSSAYIDFENEFGQGMSAMGDSIKTNLIATLTQAHGLIVLMKADGSLSKTATIVNGSHFSGLSKVPYDGYVAELHKDETVLTSDEAGTWRTIKSMGILNNLDSIKTANMSNQLSNFNLPKMNTPNISSIKNNSAPIVNFNESFMKIGNVGENSMPDLEKFASRIKNEVTKSIYDAIKA